MVRSSSWPVDHRPSLARHEHVVGMKVEVTDLPLMVVESVARKHFPHPSRGQPLHPVTVPTPWSRHRSQRPYVTRWTVLGGAELGNRARSRKEALPGDGSEMKCRSPGEVNRLDCSVTRVRD